MIWSYRVIVLSGKIRLMLFCVFLIVNKPHEETKNNIHYIYYYVVQLLIHFQLPDPVYCI